MRAIRQCLRRMIWLLGAMGTAALALGVTAPAGVAASQTDPNLSGDWNIVSTALNVPPDSPYRIEYGTYTFTRTAPNTYSVSNGVGWTTTDVVITGRSFTLWFCGYGGTYSAKDEGACRSSSYEIQPWKFDFTGPNLTATGSYHDAAHANYGTFKATGPPNTCAATDSSGRGPFATTATVCHTKVVLSGTVFEHKCEGKRAGKSCRHQAPAPVAGEPVVVTGSRKTYETESRAEGAWSLKVPRGTYTVRLKGYGKDGVKPDSRRVDARGDRSGLDFTICRSPEDYHGNSFDCKTVEIEGRVFGSDGKPYFGLGVFVDCEGDRKDETDRDGRFVIYTEPGRIAFCLLAGGNREEEVANETVDASKDTTIRLTVPTKIFPDGVSRDRVGYFIAGLPTTVSNFTVDLRRDPPIDSNACSSTGSQEISRDGRDAGGQFLATGVIADHFCPGSYTITVTDNGTAGFEWAKEDITIP